MDLDSLLLEFGSRFGVGPVRLDRFNSCSLVFGDLEVQLEKTLEPAGVIFLAIVGPMPIHHREEIFAQLLEANLQAQGTGPACLAYERDVDWVVLNRFINETSFEIDAFEQELERFLQVLEFWKHRLNQLDDELFIASGDLGDINEKPVHV